VLYHDYKQYGSGLIPVPVEFDPASIKEEIREILDDVYAVYGQFSAWKLRNMTHSELPWQEAANTAGVISLKTMKEYFKAFIKDE
jgi:uncharacterized phage-associated protein